MLLQVGVKVLIKNNNDEYLFLRRALPYPGDKECKWDVPGGRIEEGEPLIEALRRELKEETQLRLSVMPQVIFAQDILRVEGKHTVRITYLAEAEGEIVLDPKEHQEYQWLSLSEGRKLYHDTYLTPVLELLLSRESASSTL